MESMTGVVKQLKKEHARLTDELHRVTTALTAFVGVYKGAERRMKKEAGITHAAERNKIAAAQRARWRALKAEAEEGRITRFVVG